MSMHLGLLTSGGDCPGLNAALRAVGRAAQDCYGMRLTGFRNGFRGLAQDQSVELDSKQLSGILTLGGTILGTSRDKPHRMSIGGRILDMTPSIIETYKRHNLDALVCLGGGGTQKNALRLQHAGLNVVTLPKTIDNDIVRTDRSFGFDTALDIATEAIDRLHSTATSHNRIIVVEVMGHRAGWLALEAGVAGGADVILIPEKPYDANNVAGAIQARTRQGKRFSIIVIAEGALSQDDARIVTELAAKRDATKTKTARERIEARLKKFYNTQRVNHAIRLTRQLENLVGQESRLTILGHLQRGGTPSSADRVLATRLGTACAENVAEGRFGIMLALQGNDIVPVPLEEVAGSRKLVPPDHPLVRSAEMVGTSFGC